MLGGTEWGKGWHPVVFPFLSGKGALILLWVSILCCQRTFLVQGSATFSHASANTIVIEHYRQITSIGKYTSLNIRKKTWSSAWALPFLCSFGQIT